ncbi:hypothetical protein ACPOL_4285 [Acidisarcina polymorpha]|uniref:Uncharacterized protein n=1 Tax=Acidisarcina polymorpha TaxID=2211140 RepID=A0A2Z5G3E2_9BACT|nr:hypothetical protein [Acidisarcina polymorpha]AXC13560.1 hypothetical protein ACPOL_4285 [Acidisarcina polymorpha]
MVEATAVEPRGRITHGGRSHGNAGQVTATNLSPLTFNMDGSSA